MIAPAAGRVCYLRAFARPRLWLGLWCALIVLVIALSLLPPIDLDVPLPSSDKLGHLLAYFLLSAFAVQLFARRRALALAALGLVLLGIALEGAQGLLFPTIRDMDGWDALANTAGVGIGLLVAATRFATTLQRIERRLFAREPL